VSDSAAVPLNSSESRSVARNAAALAIASIASKGAAFIWQLVLARLLMQSDYGIYGTILGMLSIASTLVEFGIGPIVLRDVSRRWDTAGRVLSATLTVQPLLTVVAYAGLLAAGWLLGYSDAIRALLPLAGLSLLLDLLGNMPHNQLLAREQMVIPSIISVGHILVQIALVALALLGGLGLAGLYWATIVAGAGRALVYWIVLVRSGIGSEWPLDWQILRGLLFNGAPLALNAFMSMAYQHADKLIITASIGEGSTALLLPAFTIVFGLIELLSTTVLTAVFPMMSRQYADGDHAAFNFLVEKIAFLTLVLVIPISAALTVYAALVLDVLYPPEYLESTLLVQIFVWYGALAMVSNVFARMLVIRNLQVRLLMIRAGALALNILLLMVLLPRIGIAAAGIGTFSAEALIVVLLFNQWEARHEVLPRLWRRLVRLAAAGGLMLGVMAVLWRLAGEPLGAANLPLAIGIGIVGLSSYLGAVALLGVIAPEDRRFIRQVLISIPGGSLVARVWR
jgi:O-antigen/teichoic acid export membrane protein